MRKLITRLIDGLYFPVFRKWVPLQTFRYGMCGSANLLFDYLLFFLFYNYLFCEQILHLGFVAISPHIASFLLEFPIILFTGFWLNKNIVFRTSLLKTHVQAIRYFIVVLGSILLNYICLKIFVDYCALPAEIAKIITIFISIAYSYFMQKNFTFRTLN